MDIGRWLTQVVSVSPVTGRGGSGDPTYGPITTLKARIEKNVRLRVGIENTLADVHVMATQEPVPVGSRVWFPEDTVTPRTARRTLAQRTATNQDGSYAYYESYFAA